MATGPGPSNAGRSRTLFEQIGGGCRVVLGQSRKPKDGDLLFILSFPSAHS